MQVCATKSNIKVVWTKLLKCTKIEHVVTWKGNATYIHAICVIIFNTGGQFRIYIVTRSYSSRPFLCAFGSVRCTLYYTLVYVCSSCQEHVRTGD